MALGWPAFRAWRSAGRRWRAPVGCVRRPGARRLAQCPTVLPTAARHSCLADTSTPPLPPSPCSGHHGRRPHQDGRRQPGRRRAEHQGGECSWGCPGGRAAAACLGRRLPALFLCVRGVMLCVCGRMGVAAEFCVSMFLATTALPRPGAACRSAGGPSSLWGRGRRWRHWSLSSRSAWPRAFWVSTAVQSGTVATLCCCTDTAQRLGARRFAALCHTAPLAGAPHRDAPACPAPPASPRPPPSLLPLASPRRRIAAHRRHGRRGEPGGEGRGGDPG